MCSSSAFEVNGRRYNESALEVTLNFRCKDARKPVAVADGGRLFLFHMVIDTQMKWGSRSHGHTGEAMTINSYLQTALFARSIRPICTYHGQCRVIPQRIDAKSMSRLFETAYTVPVSARRPFNQVGSRRLSLSLSLSLLLTFLDRDFAQNKRPISLQAQSSTRQ